MLMGEFKLVILRAKMEKGSMLQKFRPRAFKSLNHETVAQVKRMKVVHMVTIRMDKIQSRAKVAKTTTHV